jgi:hypothetical protein
MRLVLKTKNGTLYRLTDPEAAVTPDEWSRVMNLLEQITDIANKYKVSLFELLLCMNEQIDQQGGEGEHGK